MKLLTCIEVNYGLLLVGIVRKVDIGRLGVLVDGIVHLEGRTHNHNSEISQRCKQTCIEEAHRGKVQYKGKRVD